MALTDRTANCQLNAARVASNVDISNPQTLAAQVDQRHIPITAMAIASLTAGATYRFYGFVADRAYQVISARVIAGSAITAAATSFVTVNVVSNNDAGGADTILATYACSTTALTAGQSTPLVVQSTNTVASGSQVDLVFGYASSGAAINFASGGPAYVVDLVVQEV